MGGWSVRKSRLPFLPALPMVAGGFYPLAPWTSQGTPTSEIGRASCRERV
jgi:hypothetical protein